MDAVLEAEELPAGVARLDAGLADVDRDALAHGGLRGVLAKRERKKAKGSEGESDLRRARRHRAAFV